MKAKLPEEAGGKEENKEEHFPYGHAKPNTVPMKKEQTTSDSQKHTNKDLLHSMRPQKLHIREVHMKMSVTVQEENEEKNYLSYLS